MKRHNKRTSKFGLEREFSLQRYLESLATDLEISPSLHNVVSGALRARRYDQVKDLYDLHAAPVSNPDADTYYRNAVYFAAFRKIPLKGSDTVKPAVEKYFASEQQCKETNRTMPRLWRSMPYGRILARMQDVIHEIISGVSAEDILSGCRHGPGMSVDLPKDAGTTPFYKWYSGNYGVSDRAYPYLVAALVEETRAINRVASGYNESRLAFVPKTMWTDRSINIEPRGNVFLQLGVGDALARAFLDNTGLSIWDQSLNQAMARHGSIHGNYATLDLSSASDTIAWGFVRTAFSGSMESLRIFDLMDALRSHKVEFKGKIIYPEKFASMGNGYIFPLQCILFYALCRSIMDLSGIPGMICVYGDDIIIPTDAYHLVTEALQVLGFSVNPEKSFHTGPFRESCGADFWNGTDVRPPTTSKIPTRVWHVYTMLNNLQHKVYAPTAWDYLHSLIPKELRLYGPPSSDDMDSWIQVQVPDLYALGALSPKGSKHFNLQCLHHSRIQHIAKSYRHEFARDEFAEDLHLELKLSQMGVGSELSPVDVSRSRGYDVNRRKQVRTSVRRTPLRIEGSPIVGIAPRKSEK
jgi:hypothetical protein